MDKGLEAAIDRAVEEAMHRYLDSGVADRDAITRLADRLMHIHLLAEKVPDAVKKVQDDHAANHKAQQDAAKASSAKEPPPAPKSQTAAR